MPPIKPNDTAVVDEPWDGPGQVAKLKSPVTRAVGEAEFAWYDGNADDPDGDGYPDAKDASKFPHHEVDDQGKPGAANVNGCRNGLARLSGADIPEGDKAGVREHLQHHIDAFNRSSSKGSARQAAAERAEALAGLEEAGEPGSVPQLAKAVLHMAAAADDSAPQLAEGLVSVQTDADDEVDEAPARDLLLGKWWAITQEALLGICATLTRFGGSLSSGEGAQAALPRRGRATTQPMAGGKEIAVIPLRGTITPRGSFLSILFGGGGGLDAFRTRFREAVADGNTGAIIIDIDSPGGLIDLVAETADEIRAARGSKPIVAIANTLAASAAYWIASAADEIAVTPSGQVGSIGVFTIHEDFSRMEDMMGIKTTLISAGQFKVDGNPYEPLSKTARQALQQQVDELYAMFTAGVAAGRGVSVQAIQAGYGRGRCVLAQQALQLGMADRIETFEQLATRLGGVAEDPPATASELCDDDDETSPVSGDPTPPVRADQDGGDESHPTADYLSGEALREQPAWLLSH